MMPLCVVAVNQGVPERLAQVRVMLGTLPLLLLGDEFEATRKRRSKFLSLRLPLGLVAGAFPLSVSIHDANQDTTHCPSVSRL